MTTVETLMAQATEQMTGQQQMDYYLQCEEFAANKAIMIEEAARILRHMYKVMGLVGEEAGGNLTDEEIVAECREGN